MSKTEVRYRDAEWLREKYVNERWSTYDISEYCGISGSTVRKWMDRFDIPRRNRGTPMKMYCPTRTKPAGYVVAQGYQPNEGNGEWVYIHRLLAISEYGFDAVCDNDVHHKNGIPWDNRPENIELMTHSEHAKHHDSLKGNRWRGGNTSGR